MRYADPMNEIYPICRLLPDHPVLSFFLTSPLLHRPVRFYPTTPQFISLLVAHLCHISSLTSSRPFLPNSPLLTSAATCACVTCSLLRHFVPSLFIRPPSPSLCCLAHNLSIFVGIITGCARSVQEFF